MVDMGVSRSGPGVNDYPQKQTTNSDPKISPTKSESLSESTLEAIAQRKAAGAELKPIDKNNPPGSQSIRKAQDEVKNPKPTLAAKSGTWKKSDLTAKQLASKVDSAISNLQSTKAETWINVSMGPKDVGYGASQVMIQDRKRFFIETANPYLVGIDRGFLAGDGSNRAQFLGEGRWQNLTKTTKFFDLQGAQLLQRLPLDFTRLLYAPLVSDVPIWSRIAEAGSRGSANYKLVTERTVNKINGRDRPQYRYLLQRANPPSRIEIRIDGVRYLPVTVLVEQKEKGHDLNFNWSAAWQFNQKLDPAKFGFAQNP
jgi:hypothetical protein